MSERRSVLHQLRALPLSIAITAPRAAPQAECSVLLVLDEDLHRSPSRAREAAISVANRFDSDCGLRMLFARFRLNRHYG